MNLEIIKPGLATSVQDMERTGFGGFGVPKSGVMDVYSAKFANMLVGNAANDAVLEITQLGPKLRFPENSLVAISGLGAEILLNQTEININEAFLVKSKDVLEIKRTTKGNRAYLAVFGGFRSKKVLNSRSMYEGVTPQFVLKKGGFLEIDPFFGPEPSHLSSMRFMDESYLSDQIRVFPGPEFELLSLQTKRALFQRRFTVSNDSNRMACLFEENLSNKLKQILTGPVLPGTVQLTPDGKLIVLMRDCQVTGGYPRVLQVVEESMNVLAQKRAGESIVFCEKKY